MVFMGDLQWYIDNTRGFRCDQVLWQVYRDTIKGLAV